MSHVDATRTKRSRAGVIVRLATVVGVIVVAVVWILWRIDQEDHPPTTTTPAGDRDAAAAARRRRAHLRVAIARRHRLASGPPATGRAPGG